MASLRKDVRRAEVAGGNVSAYCHATEEMEKVRQALLNTLPKELRNVVAVSIEKQRGFYGNPITILKVNLNKEEALLALQHMLVSLTEADRRYLLNSLPLRYDEEAGKLYVRLDKQEAYLGKIVLYDGDDTVRMAFSFAQARRVEDVRRVLEDLLGEGEGT